MSYFSSTGKFTRVGRLLLALWLVPNCANAQTPLPQPQPQPQPTPTPTQAVPDIFAVRNWMPPPPAPEVAKVVVPKRPPVPQLPFRFIGKISDPDKPMVFLLGSGDRILSVSVGDVIAGAYLVEKYERTHLYFIYKPMKARQSLFVGSTS